MRLITLTSVAVAVIATTGCTESSSPAELSGRTFVSQQVDGDQIPGGGPLTVGFDGKQISTFAGCNHGSGTADLSEGRIATQLAMTMMACAPPAGDSDAWVSRFFAAQPAWSLDGDTLTLQTDAATVTLRDKKVVDPDRPLTGTTWRVTSLISAQAVTTSVALEQAKPTLTIAPDGAVSGFTGCNQITGHATVSGAPAVVEFGPLGTTKKACPPEVTEVEHAVLRVLTGSVQTAIDSDELHLTGADGYGLILRAEAGR
ncbi:META domain-containing protein [Mycobacterium sp. TNTM28]|uniref:META domain-containing protein n=1 Tax=[Mycobacterium] fortunisiensis TaxID=2600579 RepID=A0ABS6KLZ5_9MYCO|nr:META domain-containing protein [[Mycobacterium] fortunisiensis]MBU9764622.1 META domain-containing protein [[Mycobacterium] fortunisiensis]